MIKTTQNHIRERKADGIVYSHCEILVRNCLLVTDRDRKQPVVGVADSLERVCRERFCHSMDEDMNYIGPTYVTP